MAGSALADSLVAVDGLDELLRGLRQASKEAALANRREMRVITKKVSAAARVTAAGQSRMYRKAKSGITPTVDSRGTAGITISGKRYPWIFGAEFGAKRNVHRKQPIMRSNTSRSYQVTGWNQFKPWRGNQFEAGASDTGPGYAVYPTIRKMAPEISGELMKAVMASMRRVM